MEEKVLYCVGCNQFLEQKSLRSKGIAQSKDAENNFWTNHNSLLKNRNYHHLYCKSCCKKISDNIFKKYNNYNLACIEMCSVFYMPYHPEACEKMKKHEENKIKDVVDRDINRVYQYGQVFLKEVGFQAGKWDDLCGNNLFKDKLLKVAHGNNDGDDELLDYLKETWGVHDNIEDYLFLQKKYLEYAEGTKPTAATKNTLRYLCEAELDVIKLKEKKADQKEISAAEKRVIEYYKLLNLNDFDFKREKTEFEKSLEYWTFTEEKKEPLEWEGEEADELKNRCKFREDNDEIMRALLNKVAGTRKFATLDYSSIVKR